MPMMFRVRILHASMVLSLAAACVGTVEDGPAGQAPAAPADGTARPSDRSPVGTTPPGPSGAPPTTAPPATPGAPEAPGAVVMRRLTRWEYDNTVRDLLAITGSPAADFPPEESSLGFDNNASALTFSPPLAQQAFTEAETLGRAAATNAKRWAPCAATTKTEACAREFIAAFGTVAWRRPLTDKEVARIAAVFAKGATFERGLELAATTALASLPFFYRVELGDGVEVPGKPGLVRPTSWEMASRLSYTLWGTMPDAPLIDAARADRLKTADAVRQQAQRMLADPRARPTVARFHAQWLQLAGIGSANKDPKLFPTFKPEFPALLQREAETFLENAAFGGGGLKDILAARHTFLSRDLAALYGVTPPAGTDFARVALDAVPRAGFLTQAGTMAMLAEFTKTSPIRRGVFVRRQILCDHLPEPPPGAADMVIATPPAGATRRQLTELHSTNPECASCHRLIDPIGVALEGYDAAGRHRTMEEGKPIDDRGEVVGTAIGTFKGGVELADKLAASREARACFVKQLFRFALGRTEAGSAADLQKLDAVAESTGGKHVDLLLALTQTDAFLTLPRGGGAP